MTGEPPDPAPRSYPSFVTLLRRGRFDLEALGRPSLAEVESWLLGEAADHGDLLEVFQSFVWRLVAAGLPLDRASLHVGTLHPQLFGYAWNWSRDDGLCDEVKVDEAVLGSDAYRRNPLYRVIEHGETFRGRTDAPDVLEQGLLADLARQEIVEYLAMPLSAGGDYHNAATVATRQAEGFSAEQISNIDRLLRLLALHVARHIAARIAENLVNTYLGDAAGSQVLQGSIKRGSGAPIGAIIWASDLRGFTDLADRLDDRDVLSVLNAYFERLAGAVMAHDGEVLKFIGDGLLAVFPFSAFETEQAAARAALAAARSALSELDLLNEDKSQLAEIDGWRPLRTGIALHRGDVFFGNLGAPRRLDFTVIGKAVNAVSRVEGLSKPLGRPILFTEPVAELLDVPLETLGTHALKGLSEPLPIFSPR